MDTSETPTPITLENVESFFRYHPPTAATIPLFEEINNRSLALAKTILECCPDSEFRRTALTAVVGARMFANAAIATEKR